MRVFQRQLLWFSIIVVLLAASISFLLHYFPLDPVHYRLQFEEAETQKVHANAIILGTSHATHAIRPSLLDQSEFVFYNFALNGAGSGYYLHWYKELFSPQYPTPQYCVLAVDWFMFDQQKLWRRFEQDSEYFSDDLFMNLYRRSDEYNRSSLVNNRFLLLKYRSRMLKMFKSQRFYEEEYDKGFIPLHLDFDTRRFQLKQDPVSAQVSQTEKDHFVELVDMLLNDGIKLIFLMTPEYGIDENLYETSKAITFISETANKYGIPFINYNTTSRQKAINEKIANFADWGHMSPAGSTAFSEIVSIDLAKIMTPH